jgi:hypothetical protein
LAEFTARLLCSRFLLHGETGELQSDRMTRVSHKTLAFTALASLTLCYPALLALKLHPNGGTLSQSEL